MSLIIKGPLSSSWVPFSPHLWGPFKHIFVHHEVCWGLKIHFWHREINNQIKIFNLRNSPCWLQLLPKIASTIPSIDLEETLKLAFSILEGNVLTLILENIFFMIIAPFNI